MTQTGTLKLFNLVQQLKPKILYGDKIKWALQRKSHVDGSDTEYHYMSRPLQDSDLVNHFSQSPIYSQYFNTGSMSIGGIFSNDKALWAVLDCDNPYATEVMKEKIIPVLKALDIDYIEEISGEYGERAHLRFFCDSTNKVLQSFIDYIFVKADVNKHDRKLDYEIYPCGRAVRLEGGYHVKWGKANDILYKGEQGNSPEFVIKCMLDARQVTDEYMRHFIQTKEAKPRFKGQKIISELTLPNQGLTLPKGEFPSVVAKISTNCQLYNKLIWESVDEDLIEAKGGIHHETLFILRNLGLFHDHVTNTRDGLLWSKEFENTNRSRGVRTHALKESIDGIQNPAILIPRCDTLQNKYGEDYCKGCPFFNRPGFTSPRQVLGGKKRKKKVLRKLRLVAADKIRKGTFTRFRDRIFQAISQKEHTDIVLASSQGSGKSFMIDEVAAQLAEEGKKVLIAVPTTQLAMEHAERLTERGQRPFLLMSHENMFDKLNPGFDCPKHDEIQRAIKLRAPDSSHKKKYCKSCPFFGICPYPEQYKQVKQERYQIVIMQHSYFNIRETLGEILKKNFDVLIVDESFMENVLTTLKPTRAEIEVLEGFEDGMEWVKVLNKWLKVGGYPENEYPELKPSEEEFQAVKTIFDLNSMVWNLPDYIEQYNNGQRMLPKVGLYLFHPIPNVPIRIFTDATPPRDMLSIVLDNKNIEFFGDDEVLDVQFHNKSNQIIQILDGSTSVSSMKKNDHERLYIILEFIGDLCRKEYPTETILITTYKEFKQDVEDWLSLNYPDVALRTLVSWGKIGTNEFEDINIQFLITGRYMHEKHFAQAVYELKFMENYWRQLNGEPIVENFYQFSIGDNASTRTVEEPLRRIEIIDGNALLIEYEDFKYKRPELDYYNIIDQYNIAKMQQFIRLRFNDDKLKVAYIFTNSPLPSFPITQSPQEIELVGYLYK